MLKNSLISNDAQINFNSKHHEEKSEIKALRSELELYKQYSQKLNGEVEFYKKIVNESKTSLKEFESNSKELFDIECKNLKNTIEVIKVNHLIK